LSLWSFSLLSKKDIYQIRTKSSLKIAKELVLLLYKPFLFIFIFALLLGWVKNPVLFFLIFGLLDLFFLLGFRKAYDFFLRYLKSKEYFRKNILLLGTKKMVKDFIKELSFFPEKEFKILGILEKDQSKKGQRYNNFPVLGGLNLLETLLKNCYVDFVVFAFPEKLLDSVKKEILLCQRMGVSGYLFTDLLMPTHIFPPQKVSKKTILHKKIFLVSRSFPERIGEQGFLYFLKCFIDRLGALILIILTLPLFIIVSVLIKLTSEGPVFFKQKRCGLNGKRFLMYKFRTMVEDAESKKKYLITKNEMDGAAFKIKDDPRITEVGKFLRKFSLDELPQLFNVLSGNMSLVGPRPPLPEEVSQYKSWHRKRLSVKPGLTCLWQINGRNDVSFEDWMRMDLEYIKNWSLLLDLKILLKTLPSVISARGAR